MKSKIVILIFLGSAGLFSMILLIALETTWFENTFDAAGLAKRAAIIGIVTGFLASYLLTRKIEDTLDRVKISLAILITSLILFPLAGSISNRLFAATEPLLENVLLFKEIPYYSGRFGLPPKDELQWTGYYIFVVRNEKIERLVTKKALFLPEMAGQNVQIQLRRGYWGYDFFEADKY